MFPFLWTGALFDLYQLSGEISEFNELRNCIDNGFTKLVSQILVLLVNMLSWPWALLMFKARMFLKISLSSKSSVKIVTSCKQSVSVGVELSFSTGAYCLVKYKLKKLALSRKLFMTSSELFKLWINWKLDLFFFSVI